MAVVTLRLLGAALVDVPTVGLGSAAVVMLLVLRPNSIWLIVPAAAIVYLVGNPRTHVLTSAARRSEATAGAGTQPRWSAAAVIRQDGRAKPPPGPTCPTRHTIRSGDA